MQFAYQKPNDFMIYLFIEIRTVLALALFFQHFIAKSSKFCQYFIPIILKNVHNLEL